MMGWRGGSLRAFGLCAALACAGRAWPANGESAPAAPAAGTSDGERTAIRAALEDGLYEVARRGAERGLAAARKGGVAADQADYALWLLRALHGLGQAADMPAVADAARKACIAANREDEWLYWRAAAAHAARDWDRAVQWAGEAARKNPTSPLAGEALRLEAAAHAAAGRVDAALDGHRRYDREYGQSAAAARNLLDWGHTLTQAARHADAVVVYERAAALDAARPEALEGKLRLAAALAAIGKWDAAAARARSVVDDERVAGDARARAGRILAGALRESGDAVGAAAALTRTAELANDAGIKRIARIELGRLLLAGERLDEGVKLLKESIAAAPSDELSRAAQLDLAQGLHDRGRAEAAEREFRFYLETYSDPAGQARAHEGRGLALSALGRHAEASGAFLKAVDLQTTDAARARCLFKAGDAEFANGQYGPAAETYGRVAVRFPESDLVPRARYQVAESKARAGDTAEAGRLFAALAAAGTPAPVAHAAALRLAGLRETAGQWDEAIQTYDAFLAAHPASPLAPDAVVARGLARYRRFDFEAAMKDFDRIAGERPRTGVGERAAFYRTLCRYWLGRDDEAESLARVFLTEYASSTMAPSMAFWLGRLLFNRGNFPAAEERMTGFAARHPGHELADDALLWAGLAAQRRKDYVRSVELLARLVKEHPAGDMLPEARFAQAESLMQLSRHAEAILLLDEIVAKHPDTARVAAVWARKGDCQFTLGAEDAKRYEESLASYRAARAAGAGELEFELQCEYKIGRCYEKMGRPADALDRYHAGVIARYMREYQKTGWMDEASRMWFTRAAFGAAEILRARQDWRAEARVLERIVDAGVPAAGEASERLRNLKSERWWIW